MADLEAGVAERQHRTLHDAKRYKKRGRVVAVIKGLPKRLSSGLKSSRGSSSTVEDYEDVDEHLLSLADLAARYGTAVDMQDPAKSFGLTAAEAQERLAVDGRNELNPPKPQNPVLQYLKLLTEPLTAMLLLASLLAICSQAASPNDYTPSYLGAVLFLVVTGNTIVDFWQARKSAAMVKVRQQQHCSTRACELLNRI
jgi:Cation transporter/ATPase, N-terminus